MKPLKISIADDYSPFPIGRYTEYGPYNGQTFREKHLVPMLKKATKEKPLRINLNKSVGYPCSFLDSAFAGLVREEGYESAELRQIMRIEGNKAYKEDIHNIWQYIKEADDFRKHKLAVKHDDE